MIPEFEETTGNLPPGIHEATWDEITQRFSGTMRRRELLDGLKRSIDELRKAGCRRVYIDGSFISRKRNPNDFDACWETNGVDETRLDPVLLDFANERAAQKMRYGGEWFLATQPLTTSGRRALDFFQRDKRTGAPKGIIALTLGAPA
jgi:hypothetical protein